jgi:PAS domain S-box-containing protein
MTNRKTDDGPVRILIVDDCSTDAMLVEAELERVGLGTLSLVVDRPDAFEEALSGFGPDVVLTDYQMPRFTGREVLRATKIWDPDLPVVLVTGAIPEDDAIALLREGMTDYVLKDHLSRVGPSVVHALDWAASQRDRATSRAALLESERRFRGVVEAAADAVFIIDGQNRIEFCNRAAEEMVGSGREDFQGLPITRVLPKRVRVGTDFYRDVAAVFAEKKVPGTFTTEAETAAGVVVPVEVSVSEWGDGSGRRMSLFVRNLSERIESARTRDLLSKAVEQSSNIVIITDVDGTIEYANPTFEHVSGYSVAEVIGENPRLLKSGKQSEAFYEAMWRELAAGRPWTSEFVNRTKDGTEYRQRSTIFPITNDDGHVVKFVGVGEDVTHERRLEDQLRQAQKMEAVGQLTAGIAHDFNNVLTSVLSNAQLLGLTLPEAMTEEREEASDIQLAARRGADLVRKLMTFSRQRELEPELLEIGDVLSEIVALLRRTLPVNIELRVETEGGPAVSYLERGALQQILLNLATNARDAMPEGGELTIRSRPSPGTDDEQPSFIRITVTDTGTGIDEETLGRVFEPFFTTKEPGRGTGLGLATVYGLVESQGGCIDVESEIGVGTSFDLSFPLVDDPEEAGDDTPDVAESHHEDGLPTILLVEDEEAPRRAARRTLEREGYRLIEAANGEEALEVLEGRQDEIDLVLSDLMMPRMGGGALYAATRAWENPPRFLFISGYRDRDVRADIEDIDEVPFLRKPWEIQDLVSAVREALGGQADAPQAQTTAIKVRS